MPEVYVSVDVEADGPIPGPNSMLSLGAVAFDTHAVELTTFKANLQPLPGAAPDPETAAWWRTQPEAYRRATEDAQPAEVAMVAFAKWLDLVAIHGAPVFVGYPAGYDFTYVRWYMIRFTGRSRFGISSLDIKTLAMAVMATEFRSTTKATMPRHWFDGLPAHTHDALDDAREQGLLFFRIRGDTRRLLGTVR